jgi:poly-gamma-glutamate synthesis protein (capsule biosynthesis protein)
MIFLGDIAHPFSTPPVWKDLDVPWEQQRVVINLEGTLVADVSSFLSKRAVFNHVSVCEALRAFDVRVVNLANNHVLDIPSSLPYALEKLNQEGFVCTGAGPGLEAAMKPAVLEEKGQKWLFLGCGWETIQCIPGSARRPGVCPFNPKALLGTIQELRSREPNAVIVLMPHWNYELELYPQPAHRQFAMAAIDAGANAIIGHHPHRVGGIEMYRKCPIVYSLGNWWMPHGQYFNGRLRFGDETLPQMGFEWEPGREAKCHWFEYEREGHDIRFNKSEKLSDSKVVQELTPFSDMSHDEYVQWFPKNRIKRKALPVYRDYRDCLRNRIRDDYVKMRQVAVIILEKTGLRKFLKI